MITEEMRWVLGAVASAGVFMLTVWWRVESRQDGKIDKLRDQNSAAHSMLHKKIDEVESELTRQHTVLRDKIEDIWKHIVRNGKGP